MAQETRFTSSGEQFDRPYDGPIDLDEFGSQLRPYRNPQSVATREDHYPDDPAPLFLSDAGDYPTPAFGKARNRGVISRRPIRTSIALIAAAVTCYAVLSVKNPFPVFANATATLIGMSDVRSTPVPSAPAVQPATVAAVQPAPSVQAPTPAPREMPTRDEIALAIRSAHQSLAPAEIRQPVAVAPPESVAPPAPPPPARKISADELATLMTRAKGLLAAGDIPPARLLLERAADALEPSAALMLAQTYDPAVLGTRDTRNINTDPALARTWYQRAAQLGSADAQRRLSQLQ
ncbi:hypothetical protein [Bradyrhizobium sp.]|uniref:hypothetical protein n=1 Tax=Bradyrhizobium sp. TaxID=376 RepID=UPI003C7413C0